jgi:cytochrome c-type biogenesis protein CcmH/NrfG
VTRRLIVLVAVAASAVAATMLGGAFRGSSSPGALAAVPGTRLLEPGAGSTDTTALVAGLQQRLQASPRDAQGWALLGLAYQ